MEEELTERDLEERIKYLQTRAWNLEQNVEFLFKHINVCGQVPRGMKQYDFEDICILKRGHKGLHKSLDGFTWGWKVNGR